MHVSGVSEAIKRGGQMGRQSWGGASGGQVGQIGVKSWPIPVTRLPVINVMLISTRYSTLKQQAEHIFKSEKY